MVEHPDRPALERRPHLALAAKLLIALGFAIVLMLVRGQAADAVEPPVGPLAGVPAGPQEVTRTVRTVAAPVVEVAPPTPESRSTTHRAPGVQRSVRVVPNADDTEAIRLDLHLDRDQLDVEVAPRTPGRVLPIRVQLPSLLDGLPSIEVAVVDGAPVTSDRAAPGAEAATAPATAAAPSSTKSSAARTERATRGVQHATAPAEPAQRLPVSSGTESPLPAGVAPVAGTVLAVLASIGFRRAAQPSQIVHAAQRRVPVAPVLRPSFTPD